MYIIFGVSVLCWCVGFFVSACIKKRRARQYEESEFASQPVEMYPGVQQPVYAQPVYTQPMYGQPGYGPPVYVQDGYVQQSNGRSYGYDRGDGGRRGMRGGTVAAGVGGGLLGGLILGSALDGGGGDFGGGFESGDF